MIAFGGKETAAAAASLDMPEEDEPIATHCQEAGPACPETEDDAAAAGNIAQ